MLILTNSEYFSSSTMVAEEAELVTILTVGTTWGTAVAMLTSLLSGWTGLLKSDTRESLYLRKLYITVSTPPPPARAPSLNHDFRLDFRCEKNSRLIRLGRGGGSGTAGLPKIRENSDLLTDLGSGGGEGTGSGAGLENIREKKLLVLTTSVEF